MALVLANEALRKFGGDSVEEFVRNHDALRRASRLDDVGRSRRTRRWPVWCWSGYRGRARRLSRERSASTWSCAVDRHRRRPSLAASACPPPSIYARHGEAVFRERELEALARGAGQ